MDDATRELGRRGLAAWAGTVVAICEAMRELHDDGAGAYRVTSLLCAGCGGDGEVATDWDDHETGYFPPRGEASEECGWCKGRGVVEAGGV